MNQQTKKIFGINLVSSKNREELVSLLNKIKTKNYNQQLKGFSPDLKQSIVNISEFIEKSFDRYNEIVVFACDAISYEYYLSKIQPVSKKYNHYIGVLSSVFPSTTSVAWPSIITRTMPSEHGIYGTSFLHEDFDKNYIWISNTINDKKNREIIGNKQCQLNLSKSLTLFEKLQKKGIDSYYLGTHGQGKFNPFRQELVRGSIAIKPDKNYAELKMMPQKLVDWFIDKNKSLFKYGSCKRLIWNYIDLDDYIHEQGYNKLSKNLDWETIFKFWSEYNEDRLFLLISDHGQIKQSVQEFSILKASNDNNDLIYNSGGAGRVLYFYPATDREDEVYNWAKKIVGRTGLVMRRDELFKYKLINKNAVGVNRIGKIVAIATSANFPSVGNEYIFEHGSISSQEMFVPFIAS